MTCDGRVVGGVQPSGGIYRAVVKQTAWWEEKTTAHRLVGGLEDKDERWRGAAQSIPLDRFVSGNLYTRHVRSAGQVIPRAPGGGAKRLTIRNQDASMIKTRDEPAYRDWVML